MSGKVVVSVRMDSEVRDQFQEWAKGDRRSLGNYLESLFMQECERRKNGDVTLSSLDVKLDRLLAFHTIKEKSKSKEKKSPFDIELFDGLDREVWHRWVKHRIKMGSPMSYGEAELTVNRLSDLDQSGLNVEVLIDESIRSVWRQIVVPKEAMKEIQPRGNK